MAKAAPKKKTQGASRNAPAPKKPAPGWLWLLTGFITAAFVFFLVHLWQDKGGGKIRPLLPGESASVADAKTTAPDQAATDTAASAAASSPTHYDFYTLLPNQKVIPSKASVAAGDKAAATVASNNKQPPAPAPATAATPLPVEPEAQAPAPKTPAVIEPRPPRETWFLQAGSFHQEAEADRRRASIILLGLPVKTEHFSKDNQTWFRVVVGPLGSKDSLQSARNSLKANGIDSVTRKAG
jgi:cell division protein FtsN